MIDIKKISDLVDKILTANRRLNELSDKTTLEKERLQKKLRRPITKSMNLLTKSMVLLMKRRRLLRRV